MTLRNRLASVERTLNPTPQDPVEILVRGGLYAEAWDATIDGRRLERADDETEEAFRKRAMGEARKAKVPSFIVGGLPDRAMTEQEMILRQVRERGQNSLLTAPAP